MSALIKALNDEITRLPKERTTIRDLRGFLLNLATQYNMLTTSALSGDYDNGNAKFFQNNYDGPGPTRLRALIVKGNETFSECMSLYGQRLKLKDETPGSSHAPISVESETEIADSGSGSDDDTIDFEYPALSKPRLAKQQRIVNDRQMKNFVREVRSHSLSDSIISETNLTVMSRSTPRAVGASFLEATTKSSWLSCSITSRANGLRSRSPICETPSTTSQSSSTRRWRT
jgi:hypothetical protein